MFVLGLHLRVPTLPFGITRGPCLCDAEAAVVQFRPYSAPCTRASKPILPGYDPKGYHATKGYHAIMGLSRQGLSNQQHRRATYLSRGHRAHFHV